MSALDTSVTLEDVFQVVNSRRVPLAAELAGYLALEIAEGATAGQGDIDPRSVFIGEEGSVAQVKPKREAGGAAPAGDTETSVRGILAALLEASGSKTPALGNVAKARPGEGLRKLVEQLETALIPVNRAAGRRALARLAREVKRVTQGVGRNAAAARPPREMGDDSPRSSREAPSVPPPAAPVAQAAPVAPAAASEGRRAAAPRDDISDLLDNRTSERAPAAEPHLPEPSGPTPAPVPAPIPRHVQPVDPASGIDVRTAPVEARAGVQELVDQFGLSGGEFATAATAGELKALAGLEPTPPPPDQGATKKDDEGGSIESLLAFAPTEPPAARATDPAPKNHTGAIAAAAGAGTGTGANIVPTAPPDPVIREAEAPAAKADPSEGVSTMPAPPSARSRPASAPQLATVTGEAPRDAAAAVPQPVRARELADPRASGPGRGERLLLPLALVIALVAAVSLYVMKPGFFSGHHDPDPAPSSSGASPVAPIGSSSAGAAITAPRCHVILLVNDAPSGSEILLREGLAPLDVERMPVGARLEFVATETGYAPKRIVVPADATWDHGADGKPRYELAVQLDNTKAKLGQVDPWPPAEPGSEAGGNGPPGTVHVVSSPKGVEVWLLAGIGPTAKIDQQVRCDQDLDVLVAGPTTFRKRLHKSAAELAQIPTETGPTGSVDRTVTLSAK